MHQLCYLYRFNIVEAFILRVNFVSFIEELFLMWQLSVFLVWHFSGLNQ